MRGLAQAFTRSYWRGLRRFVTAVAIAGMICVCGVFSFDAVQAQTPPQNRVDERSAAEIDQSGSHSALEVPIREEVAEQSLQRQVLVPYKLPPQPYMREILWRNALGREFSPDTPAFFRDSLLQVVMRTYYLDRNNFDGTRSRAWAGGGWIAYRSGLIADLFGVHGAFYTSQKLFGPDNESGTKLLNPQQDPLNVLGQAYGLIRLPGEQEVRGGRMLVDTPLINPQDNRMVPNTFEGVQLVTLPNG